MRFVKCEKCPLNEMTFTTGKIPGCLFQHHQISIKEEGAYFPVAQEDECQLFSINIGGGIFEPHADSNLIE